MAWTEKQICISVEAGEDLTNYQHHFVKLSGGKIVRASDGTLPLGVLQENGTSGQTLSVCVFGVTPLVTDGTIATDERVSVGSTNGRGTQAGSGDVICGICLEGGGAAGEKVTALFNPSYGATNWVKP